MDDRAVVRFAQHLERQPEDTTAQEASVLAAEISRSERQHQITIARMEQKHENFITSMQRKHDTAVAQLQSEITQAKAQAQLAEQQRLADARAAQKHAALQEQTIADMQTKQAELQTQAATTRFASGGGAAQQLRQELMDARDLNATLTQQNAELRAQAKAGAEHVSRVAAYQDILDQLSQLTAQIATLEETEARAAAAGQYGTAAQCASQLRTLQQTVQDLLAGASGRGDGGPTFSAGADHRQLVHTQLHVEELRSELGVGATAEPAGELYSVICDYEALEDDDLEVREGEVVVVTEQSGEFWRAHRQGHPEDSGVLPNNYLEKC